MVSVHAGLGKNVGDITGKIRHCYISHVCHQPCLKRILWENLDFVVIPYCNRQILS